MKFWRIAALLAATVAAHGLLIMWNAASTPPDLPQSIRPTILAIQSGSSFAVSDGETSSLIWVDKAGRVDNEKDQERALQKLNHLQEALIEYHKQELEDTVEVFPVPPELLDLLLKKSKEFKCQEGA